MKEKGEELFSHELSKAEKSDCGNCANIESSQLASLKIRNGKSISMSRACFTAELRIFDNPPGGQWLVADGRCSYQ